MGTVHRFGRMVWRFVPSIMAAFPVVVVPTLEWFPLIEDAERFKVIGPSLAIGACGLVWNAFRQRRGEDASVELERLRDEVDKTRPEDLLAEVARTVFREGAWRLSIYRKAHSSDGSLGDYLIKLSSVSSDGDQGALGPDLLAIRPQTHFEHLFQSNLADFRFRRAEESGAYMDDVYDDAWEEWRRGIFGPQIDLAPDRSTFRARKFVWYGAQDPRSQTVFAVIAESAAPEGINLDHVDNALTPAWLFYASHASELRTAVADVAR